MYQPGRLIPDSIPCKVSADSGSVRGVGIGLLPRQVASGPVLGSELNGEYMKTKLTIALAALVFALTPSFAGKVADNCGCGLGVLALGEEDGLVSQVVALTLNGISWNQLFGMSSGTLECAPPDALVRNDKVRQFVASNMDQLIGDIASGDGQSLESLADLLDVDGLDRADLYSTLQQNFDNIFTSDEVTVDQVLANMDAVI